MNQNKDLIYNFNEHGLYYDEYTNDSIGKTITFTIFTIQIECDYITRNVLYVTGYLPLVKALKRTIDIPNYSNGTFSILANINNYQTGAGYEYCDYFIESKKYLFNDDIPIIYYDKINKRILIGTYDTDDKCIKVNKNTFCGIDKDSNLKYLLICIDKVM